MVLAANIRPLRNVLHNEIDIPSKFQDALESLLCKGNGKPLKIVENKEEIRQKYIKNLKKFEPSNFANFISKLVKE